MPTVTGGPDPGESRNDRMRDIEYALARQAAIPGYQQTLFEWWQADFERWYVIEQYRIHLRTCSRCRRKWLARQWVPLFIEGRLPDTLKKLLA